MTLPDEVTWFWTDLIQNLDVLINMERCPLLYITDATGMTNKQVYSLVIGLMIFLVEYLIIRYFGCMIDDDDDDDEVEGDDNIIIDDETPQRRMKIYAIRATNIEHAYRSFSYPLVNDIPKVLTKTCCHIIRTHQTQVQFGLTGLDTIILAIPDGARKIAGGSSSCHPTQTLTSLVSTIFHDQLNKISQKKLATNRSKRRSLFSNSLHTPVMFETKELACLDYEDVDPYVKKIYDSEIRGNWLLRLVDILFHNRHLQGLDRDNRASLLKFTLLDSFKPVFAQDLKKHVSSFRFGSFCKSVMWNEVTDANNAITGKRTVSYYCGNDFTSISFNTGKPVWTVEEWEKWVSECQSHSDDVEISPMEAKLFA